MQIERIMIGDIPAKLFRADRPQLTVLALHGFGGSKDSWAIQGLAERLCGKGCNILAFDWPCHGERNEACSELTVERCIEDLLSVERFAESEYGGRTSVFATSFGGFVLLNRMERHPHAFERIVLRVPAVNMAAALFNSAKLQAADLSLDKAKTEGFDLVVGKRFCLPFEFYEQLDRLSAVRYSSRWNSSDMLTVWAERDELVPPEDTREFLRLNPLIQPLCISGSGHRMAERPEYLAAALDAAAAFIEKA